MTDSKATVQGFTYNSVVCSGNLEGIDGVNQNGKSALVIWDEVAVRSYTIIDSRVNINTDVNLDVLLEYEYDDSPVTDGTVTINGLSATHQSGGIWRITENKATVQGVTYDTVACSGNTYGITSVNQNGNSALVIWDQVVVRSYFTSDSRVNISTTVTIDISLEYEYDDNPVTDGTVTINGISASHQGGGVWRISQAKVTVQGVTYDTVVCSGNSHGISNVNQNGQFQTVIWDKITIRSYSTSDARVNLDDSVNIDVTLEYEYDDTPVTDGAVSINGNSATHQGGGVWRITQSQSTVQGVNYNFVVCSGNTEGITSVDQNGQSLFVIWDQITVRGYEVTDARDNVGATITITVELEYEYDDSDVTSGAVTVNSESFTYTGSQGKWSAGISQSSVTALTFDSVVVSGNTHGITDVNQNSQSQTVIWDQIQVLTTLSNDTRLDVSTYCQIWVTLQLEYDSTPLGSGDTVTLNGVAMTWDAIDGRFELNRQQTSVGLWLFFVNSSLESTYGITALNLNSQDVSVIWDQIRILSTTVDDSRLNVGSNAELRVTAELAYDGHLLTSGDTIVLDGVSMTWDVGNSWFDLVRTQASVGAWTYQVASALESTYGITALDLDGNSQQVIWDQLDINIVADMDSVDSGIQVNFTVLVTFQYDSSACSTYTIRIARNGTHWHTYTSANISLFYDSNTDVAYEYTASAVVSETTFGITEFSANTETVSWGGGTAAPVNDTAPVLTNPDDSTFMFARLKYYIITSNVSDEQGYADISYVELSLWDNTRTTEVWRIRYTEATNAFTVEVGSEYITLAAWSSYSKSVNDIDITWIIKIDWDHADFSNIDVRQYVIDSSAESDTNWYESNWDIETRLDYSVAPSLSDNRGDINTNDLVFSGTVVYYGSTLNPLANETDIWVLHDVSGAWSGNVTGLGSFSIGSISSSASVRLNTYTVKVVIEGAGSGGSDLYYTTSVTDAFITDRIEFYLSGVVDGRINVNSTGTVWWTARYDYDNTEISSGLSCLMNGSKTLLWDSINSRWYYSEVAQSVSRIGYSILSASESTYGLTGWTKSAADVSIIWDLVVIRSYSVADSRVNVSDTVNIDVLVQYEFDDSYVTDGTVLINSIVASYQGSGIWRISRSSSSVQSIAYDSVSCSGNTHGITLVNQNGQSQTVVWDRVFVSGYSVSDNHANVDDDVTVDVTLVFEYDSAPVNTGTVSINGFPATHLGGGVWRITQTRSTPQAVTFDAVTCSGNTYDITTVNQNSESAQVIFDEIIVVSYTVLDNRVDVGTSVNIDVLLNYGYDGSPVTDATVTINLAAATHQGSGVWRIIESRSSVQEVTYDTVAVTEVTYGLTMVDQNSQFAEVVWDRIRVVSYSASDTRVNLNDIVYINVTLEYEFDSEPVDDGVVIVQTILASHIEDGIWQITTSESAVGLVTFSNVECSGNSLGISTVNLNSQQQSIIWDQIVVRSYLTADARVNIDELVNIDVTLEYEYDDSPVTDASVTINGASATHQGLGVWRITDSKSTVQSATYDVVAVTGDINGIDDVNQNDESLTVIWDQVTVRSYLTLDDRVNVNDSVNIDVTLEFEFDDTDVSLGTVLVNGISATYRGSGIWRITVSESDVGAVLFDSVSVAGNEHGITDVNQNGQEQEVIWDIVAVRSITASDSRDDVGSTITVYVLLQYEYDDANVTGGLVVVNTVFFTYTGSNGIWSANRFQSIVTSETYDSVVVSGNSFGINLVNQSSSSLTIIWDRIRILTTTVDDDRIDVDSTARIMVTAELEYDNELLGSGDSLTLDGSAMTWDSVNGWFYLDVVQSSVGLWTYSVNSTGALESTYGISVVNVILPSQDVVWDRLIITITPDSSSVFDYTTVNFTLDVSFAYDSAACTTFVIDISRNGTYWVSFDYGNSSSFADVNVALTYQYTAQDVSIESTFGITVFSSNAVDVTWTTPSNFAPINNGAPVLLNADGTDAMYAKMRFYFITSSVIDYDGTSDIVYIELSLYDNSRVSEIWRVRFTVATQTFSVQLGGQYISLGGGSYVDYSPYLNITWSLKIDWDHLDMRDTDMKQYVVDSLAVSDTDYYETNWDVETRLSYSSAPSLSDNRGDVGTTDLQATGTVVYYGSSVSPLSNETDIWVLHDFEGSWSGNVDAFGHFIISSIGSSDVVRLNSYTFKVVIQGVGAGGADLCYGTSATATFITDRIEFYLSGVVDSRININENGIVWWSARYAFDGAPISGGLTAYLNGSKLLSWDAGNSRWFYQETRTSARKVGYSVLTASESGFGLTTWTQVAGDRAIIWDSLLISITSPTDQRININENATGITISAFYRYDSTPFDGIVTLNNTNFQYALVTRQYYTAASATGGVHGITTISINDIVWCIWDRVEVVSIFTNATYVDPGEYVILQMYLRYDFDDAPIISGNFSLSFANFYQVADGLWEANATRLAYQTVSYNTLTTCLASAYGITSFSMYGHSTTVYWDRLEVYASAASDPRVNVGSTAFSLWSIRLENAGIDITSGITAQATGSVGLTYVDGYWRAAHSSDAVGDLTFTILSASLGGINSVIVSSNDVTIIWDRVEVLSTSASATTSSIEEYVIVTATLAYEYDGSPVTDGVVTLWDQGSQITMTYNASGGSWYANLTKVEIGSYTFYVMSVSGNIHGITQLDVGGNQITVEFVPPPLPRLTPMMIAGISTSVIGIVALIAILVRRRYYVHVPEEIKQIDAILAAMEKDETIEEIDVKPAERSVMDLLEPGLVELGLSMVEILASTDEAGLEDLSYEADSEIAEALEDFVIPEAEYEEEEEEAIPVREIAEPESTGQFEELDIEAYTDMEAAAEEALSLMLEEVRKIKETSGVKVPLSKDDWIEKLPSSVKSMFFEEELRELDIPSIEQLAQLSPEEVEELLNSISKAQKTDVFSPEESYQEIVQALKVKFDEIEEVEELDEGAQKKRIIRMLPSFVVDHFSESWLENLSIDELRELTQLSEDELKTVIDTLVTAGTSAEPTEAAAPISDVPEPIEEVDEPIDYAEELELLDLDGDAESSDSTIEQIDDAVPDEPEPLVEPTEDEYVAESEEPPKDDMVDDSTMYTDPPAEETEFVPTEEAVPEPEAEPYVEEVDPTPDEDTVKDAVPLPEETPDDDSTHSQEPQVEDDEEELEFELDDEEFDW